MWKYCVAKIDNENERNLGEPVFQAKDPHEFFGWTDNMLHDGVIWYDSFKEAQENLFDSDEFVAANYFTEPDMDHNLIDGISVNGFLYDFQQFLANMKVKKLFDFEPKENMKKLREAQKMVDERKAAEKQKKTAVQPKEDVMIPIPYSGKGSKYDVMLKDFIAGDEKTMEIKDFGGALAGTVQRQLDRYIEIRNYPVCCIATRGKVYLAKEGSEDYKIWTEQKAARKATRSGYRKPKSSVIMAAVVGG